MRMGGGRGAMEALGGQAGGKRRAPLRSEQKQGRETGARDHVGVKSPRFIGLKNFCRLDLADGSSLFFISFLQN
jgi:hypothetical protein